MNLQGAVAVVTGADRGLGPHLVAGLLRRGAAVHAMSREPQAIARSGLWTERLDVTDPDSIARAAARTSDATLVINNEVASSGARLVDGDIRDLDREMEIAFYGALGVIREFAPILGANGGGCIVNVLATREPGALSPAEVAARTMTDIVRRELAGAGIHVAGLHVALADLHTDADVVARALDELAACAVDIAVGASRLAA